MKVRTSPYRLLELAHVSWSCQLVKTGNALRSAPSRSVLRWPGQISQRGVAIARGRRETRLDRMLERRWRSPKTGGWRIIFYESARLCTRSSIVLVWRATNWRAEQAICPMVVRRKVWGGNHTIPGARAQSVPGSSRQTLRQQLRPVSSFLQTLVCSPKT
jgi:hypothetical protein